MSTPEAVYFNVPARLTNLRRQAGRLGGLAKSARHDSREGTAAARQALRDRFIDEVDPNRQLPAHERIRRAEAARRMFYVKLSMRSAAARSKRKAAA